MPLESVVEPTSEETMVGSNVSTREPNVVVRNIPVGGPPQNCARNTALDCDRRRHRLRQTATSANSAGTAVLRTRSTENASTMPRPGQVAVS